jgi:hypothetical protein
MGALRQLCSLLLVAFFACNPAPVTDPGDAVTFELHGTLQPSQEAYLCRFVRMPDTGEDIFVRGGRHELSAGAHHYLLYRTRRTTWTDDMGAVVPCDEHTTVMKDTTGWVTGGQTPIENADFPNGAALPFKAGEILLLQGHFLNAQSTPAEAGVTLTLRTVPKSTVEAPAGVLRFYDPFIVVPARGTSRATMRCTIKKDIVLLSAAAHMHARGVNYEAYIDPPDGPPATTPFYTTTDGMRPTFFLGFMKIAAGSKIRFACDYSNKEDRTITQGLSAAQNEMCMFNAFYYPAMDPADEACADADEVGTGSATCAQTTSCLETCPVTDAPDFASGDPRVGECWQKCMTGSCPNVASALFPQLACTTEKCASECAAMGDACRACVANRCAADVAHCQAQRCGPS